VCVILCAVVLAALKFDIAVRHGCGFCAAPQPLSPFGRGCSLLNRCRALDHRLGMTVKMSDAPLGGSITPTDLCSEYKFWAVRYAISSLPKSARRSPRMDAEPTALSAWACRQPDNKRSTFAHRAKLKTSHAPLPVRRERGRVSQPLTPKVKSVMRHTVRAHMSDS
jgi:hypothetical protein